MARTPHTEEQVRAKALAYCERYGVSPGPGGLPPFPTGQRETRQHREWLTVYRALQRMDARAASVAHLTTASDTTCPICTRAVGSEEAVSFAPAGRRRVRSWRLHSPCADLVRTAEKAGPDALTRLRELLWPRHRS